MTFSDLDQLIDFITQREVLYALGVLLLLLVAAIFLLRRQPKNIVAYTTDTGDVLVKRSAVIESIHTTCDQLKDVGKPKVTVKTKGKTTDVRIEVALSGSAQLRTVEETLQRHLRAVLSNNLGIERLGRIDIIATGYKSGRVQTAPANTGGLSPSSNAPKAASEIKDSAPKTADIPGERDER